MIKTTYLLLILFLIGCDSGSVSTINNIPQNYYKPFYEIKGMGIAQADRQIP